MSAIFAAIKQRLRGEIKLMHGLFQRGQNFLSVFCYYSPESLFRQNVASLREQGYKEIHFDYCVMSAKQEVPIRMECLETDLHEFEPQQYILTPSAIKENPTVQFSFLLQHLKEPTDEVDIRYIAGNFPFVLAVKLPATKDLQRRDEHRDSNEGEGSSTQAIFSAGASPINMDRCTVNISGSTESKDLPKSAEEAYSQHRNENLVETKKKIGSKNEKIEYAECKINLSEGALKEEEEVTLSARVGVDQKKGMPDITPTYECNPPVTFEMPVSMTIRTSISAPEGKTIPASLLTRDHPGEEWKEKQKLILEQRNEVDFEIQHFGAIRVAAKSTADAKLHSINSFHIHLKTRTTAVTFSKDSTVHDSVKKSMRDLGFVDFALMPHDVQGKLGSKISVSLKREEPKNITISKPHPSSTFTLDDDYLQRGKHAVYFTFGPQPSNQCRMIRMLYGYKVDGDSEQLLPLSTEWPQEDIKKEGNVPVKIYARQVVIGEGTNMFGDNAITGGVSTDINAPVGQLAIGNANIANQGSGNNFVAGSQENTDCSVMAGKAIYGQSTSSSVAENTTVHRTGK